MARSPDTPSKANAASGSTAPALRWAVERDLEESLPGTPFFVHCPWPEPMKIALPPQLVYVDTCLPKKYLHALTDSEHTLAKHVF